MTPPNLHTCTQGQQRRRREPMRQYRCTKHDLRPTRSRRPGSARSLRPAHQTAPTGRGSHTVMATWRS